MRCAGTEQPEEKPAHTSYADLVADARSDPGELVEIEHHGDHAVLRLTDPDRLT